MIGAAARVVLRVAIWSSILGLELVVILALVFSVRSFIAAHGAQVLPRDIRIDGNASAPPQLEFACERANEQLQLLFSNPDLIDDLRHLRAGVSLSLGDASAIQAGVVRQLNEAGIPVTAWIDLPESQGYYVNADHAPDTAARFAAFEKWTSDYALRWDGIGLDIEPSLQEFGAITQGHPGALIGGVARRCFDVNSVSRARNAYAALIARMQAHGYRVSTCQFPFIADGRKVHSQLLERLFGIVDVRGDREVFMTYTSFNHPLDSALIWQYGPETQLLAVGSTSGDPELKTWYRPLNWDEFSHDLIVAGHFSPVVGVFSLEGCVRQGFLARLRTMDWGRSVTIPAEANRKVVQLRTRIQSALWTGSRLPNFAVAVLILDGWLIWRRRNRRRAAA